eukprot:GHVP01014280.1.p1 GENE.GHVP01014280.1~~GHVP01014280.1.p1  ORF type:complete len:214 (-),score=54.78 GHVP01014280.1:254-895(-)
MDSGRRILRELLVQGPLQIPQFRRSEVAEIKREIEELRVDIRRILGQQIEDLEGLLLQKESNEDIQITSATFSFPEASMIIKTDRIRLLERCLEVYKYQRFKKINRVALKLLIDGEEPSEKLLEKLSPDEGTLLRKILNILKTAEYDEVLRNLPLEPPLMFEALVTTEDELSFEAENKENDLPVPDINWTFCDVGSHLETRDDDTQDTQAAIV